MSAKTVYDPSTMISASTRNAIRALGIDLDNYTSNIASSLDARGERGLRQRMLDEIEDSLEQSRQHREAARVARRGY